MRLIEKLELGAGTGALLSGSILYFYLVFGARASGEQIPVLVKAALYLPFLLPSATIGIGTHYDLWRKDNVGLTLLIVGNVIVLCTSLNPLMLSYGLMSENVIVGIGLLGPGIFAPMTLFFRYLSRLKNPGNGGKLGLTMILMQFATLRAGHYVHDTDQQGITFANFASSAWRTLRFSLYSKKVIRSAQTPALPFRVLTRCRHDRFSA